MIWWCVYISAAPFPSFFILSHHQITALKTDRADPNRTDSLFLSLSFSILKLYRFVLISAAELFAGSSRKWVHCFVLPTLVFVLIVILLLLLLLLLVLLGLKKPRITITIKSNSWNLIEISANLEALGMLIMP